MGFTVKVTLAGNEIGVNDWSWNPKLNKLDDWGIELPNHEWHRDFLSNNRFADVKIVVDGITRITGNIDTIEWNEDNIDVTGREAAAFDLGGNLLTTTQATSAQGSDNNYRIQYDNVAADTVLSEVLTGTSYTAGDCPSTSISARGDYRSRLEWVASIAEALIYTAASGDTKEADWKVDYDSNQVDIGQPVGSDRTGEQKLDITV